MRNALEDDPFHFIIIIYHMYAQRSSRADVGRPQGALTLSQKKESNDRISTRLSRAYWPFLPLLHRVPTPAGLILLLL